MPLIHQRIVVQKWFKHLLKLKQACAAFDSHFWPEVSLLSLYKLVTITDRDRFENNITDDILLQAFQQYKASALGHVHIFTVLALVSVYNTV